MAEYKIHEVYLFIYSESNMKITNISRNTQNSNKKTQIPVCKIKGDIDSRVMDATEDDCISKV
jgi:hypothetical protein